MVATSTPSASSLLAKLTADYPHLKFIKSTHFKFSPPNRIYYAYPAQPHQNFALLTLHELAHALLKHKDYVVDLQRLKIEAAAWQKAKQLCQKYPVKWDENFAQDRLDTYRNWLHQKSACKTCGLTRYQDPNGTYHCPMCNKK